MKPTGLSEAQDFNLTRAQEGDAEAMESLLRDFLPLIKHVVGDWCPQGGERDDLIAAGMLGAWQAIKAYRRDCRATLGCLIRNVVLCRVYEAIKAAQRDKHALLNTSVVVDWDATELRDRLSDASLDPERQVLDQVAYERLRELAQRALSKLELEIVLAVAEGCTLKEAAARVNLDQKSADNALQRVRRKKGDYIKNHAYPH